MGKAKIKIGYRVGKLEVIAPTEQRKNGYTVWECQCDCGNKKLLDTRALQRGAIRDCGCDTRVPPGARDLTGQVFGRLTAIEPTDKRGSSGSIIWRCRCACGNEAFVSAGQMTKGYTKSCGCLERPPIKDYEGKKFGRLTVKEYAGKWNGIHRWKCVCDCGNETVVGQTALQSGKTKSCGCLQAEVYKKNLRLVNSTSVTVLEAVKNKRRKNNTSGYTGVYHENKKDRWSARMIFQGKKYYLGTFSNIEDAINARMTGEKMRDDFLDWYYKEYQVQ